MAFSGTTTFEKTFSIDDIITEAFERLGFFDYSGNDLRSARRSLNIMLQEWDNRGIHFWQVREHAFSLVNGQTEYVIYRSPSDGASDGITTTLTSAIIATTLTIPVASVAQMPASGKIKINNEIMQYSSISGNNLILSAVTDRGIDDTTAASHAQNDSVNNFVNIAEQFMGWCWSLAIEEQFYILIPASLLMLLFSKRKKINILLFFLIILVLNN